MECPPMPVRKAIERIQFEIGDAADEKLVATWLDWYVQQHQQEIDDTEKWQSPVKRLRSSVGE